MAISETADGRKMVGGQMPYIVRLSSCVDNERCAMKIRAMQ